MEELNSFENECSRELNIMKSRYICVDSKLFYFIKSHLSYKISTSGARASLSNCKLNKLINKMADNNISQYFDLIVDKVGKSTIESKIPGL